MLKKNLEISVLMSVYNGEKYILDAIKSVLNQSYVNFEFIIIDDGSTDNTLSIIKSFSDNRIKLIQNKKNLGLTKSLNIGLEAAAGKYIARMDADDICDPERLSLQLNYLNNHPEIGVLGTDIELINKVGKKFNSKKNIKSLNIHNSIAYIFNTQKPKSHNLCIWYLLFKNCFYHPTVIFKKDVIIEAGGYKAKRSEDLDLWSRLFLKTKFANLKSSLLYHRIHDTQTSLDRSSKEFNERIEARKRIFSSIFDKDFNLDIVRLLSIRSNKSSNELKLSLDYLEQTYIKFHKRYSLTFCEKWQIRIDYIRLSAIISNNFGIVNKIYFMFKLIITEFKK